jgi:hypothetical protein
VSCVWEMPGSNLGWDTYNRDCAVCDFPQCSNANSIIVPEIRHDVFHRFSNVLSVNHSGIPCHIVSAVESVVE